MDKPGQTNSTYFYGRIRKIYFRKSKAVDTAS